MLAKLRRNLFQNRFSEISVKFVKKVRRIFLNFGKIENTDKFLKHFRKTFRKFLEQKFWKNPEKLLKKYEIILGKF